MDMMVRIPVREQEAKERARNFEEVCYGYNKEEAENEAQRCLNCKNPRCVQGCPVSIDIPGFIMKIKEGDVKGAYQVLSASSALPAVCGRVCPQETQCEGLCVRGVKGLVTAGLEELIQAGNEYDEVIAIGPVIMMKFVCQTTAKYNIKTIISMNPIMIDGTGMCGGCRLTVGGETKFACVDGPDFDGHQVDFAEAMSRATMYKAFERKRHEETCNLFKKEVQ